MRKLLIILFCMLGMVARAEEMKMALLQPRVAEGSDACRPIELNMVRGELRKAFGWQSNFQVLTRTDVDQMLKELGFQQSGMVDDNQRKKVGEMTGAQYICVSTITKDGTQLYIESYLVYVESGQMTNPATQYANVLNNDYSTLQNPCNELAKEMLGELGGVPKKSVQVETPNKPVSTIINDKPVNLVSNNKSSEVPEGYVDLGLPSGTLWKTYNENCGQLTYEEAMTRFGNNLPTKEQWEELVGCCSWTWTGSGYKVTASNNETLYFTVDGIFTDKKKKKKTKDGQFGMYWSSTPTDISSMDKWTQRIINEAGGASWGLKLDQKGRVVGDGFGEWSCSIRLVKNQ